MTCRCLSRRSRCSVRCQPKPSVRMGCPTQLGCSAQLISLPMGRDRLFDHSGIRYESPAKVWQRSWSEASVWLHKNQTLDQTLSYSIQIPANCGMTTPHRASNDLPQPKENKSPWTQELIGGLIFYQHFKFNKWDDYSIQRFVFVLFFRWDDPIL